MKGKTFLAGMFLVLALLAVWLAWMTKGALDRERESSQPAATATAAP